MNIFTNNAQHLKIAWISGYVYDPTTNKYIYEEDAHSPKREMNTSNKLDIPETICVCIRFRGPCSSSKELYDVIGAELAKHPNMEVETTPPRRVGGWRVKDEFVEADYQAKTIIDEKNKQISKYINKLIKLGADTDGIMYLKHKTPREQREYADELYDMQSGQYKVYCRKGTWLYDSLNDVGILESTRHTRFGGDCTVM